MMSGTRWGWGLFAGVALSSGAMAQSARLRDEVRLQHPGATALAREELQACRDQGKSPCADQGRLGLLLGTLLLSEGEAAEARRVLEASPSAGPLEPHRAYAQGQAAFYTRDFEAAAGHFGRAATRGSEPLAERARVRQGEALLAAGNAKEALPLLDAALKRESSPVLLAQRARARTALGAQAAARTDWEQLAIEHPAHALAEEAIQALSTPKQPWLPAPSERLVRAEQLQSSGRSAEALAEAEALAGSTRRLDAREQARRSLLQARALTSLKRHEEAEAAFTAAMKGPPDVAAAAAWAHARQILRGTDRQKSRAAMAVVTRRFPTSREADDAAYYIGWLHLQDGQYDEAVTAFDALAKEHPRSKMRDEGAWFQALARLEQGRYLEARTRLEKLITDFGRSALVPQARYWRTRALQLHDPKADVRAEYTALIEEAPHTWYALLAQVRMEEAGLTPPRGFPKPPQTRDAKKAHAELALARELTAAALFPEAAEEIAHRVGSVRGAEQALALGHALAGLEQHGAAYALAARHLWGQAYTHKDPEALALFYPRAWASSVEQASQKQSVDPAMVWAIMRRESAFKPSALSAANARGLMQLIPPTARAIAKELGEPEPAPAELFAPGVNVRYASWYLARLLERFKHPALAAAAYNGGPGAVSRWVKAGGSQPLDLFVEKIPYKETRRYVKAVLTDLHLYRAFYGQEDKAAPLSLVLPSPTDKGVDF